VRGRERAFLVEGPRAIKQIALVAPDRIAELIYGEEMEIIPGLSFPYRRVSRAQFRSISLSQHPAGPLAVVSIPRDYDANEVPEQPGTTVLCLEDVQDPGNVGTLVRSAAAFDFSGVVCSDKCADIFSPKAVQAACGALVAMWIRRTSAFGSTLESLKKKDFRVVAADVRGKDQARENSDGKKTALVLGNEGSGISPETLRLADERYRIPFNDKKVESLNVAASGAILMFLLKSSSVIIPRP
jgi:TrmH family RNA methyltransferase